MRPSAEVKALQERIDKLLPDIVGESPERLVKVLVQAGGKEGSVNVRFIVTGEDFAASGQRVIAGDLALLTKWTDLVLKDFLVRSVKELLQAEA